MNREEHPGKDILVTLLLWSIIIILAIIPFIQVQALPDPGVRQGDINKKTSTGTQSITGLGFKPKALIFTWSLQTTQGNGDNGAYFGRGFTTGPSNQRAISTWDEPQNLLSNSDTGNATFNNASIVFQGLNGGLTFGIASLVSMDSDGFTLNWTVADANAYIIHFFAISEDIATDATADTFTLTTGTGNLSVTNAGFRPDFVMMMTGGTTTHNVNSAQLTFSTGVATSSSAQWAYGGRSVDNVATADTCAYQRTNAVIAYVGTSVACSSTTQDAFADFTQFTSTGFDINKSNAPAANMDVFYLAIKGPSFKVGSFNKPTATGSQTVTGVGFQPVGVSFTSWGKVASTAIGSEDDLSLGSSTGFGVEGAASRASRDGNTTATPNIRTSNTKTISTIETDTPTVTGEANMISLNTDGFTLNWTTADGTADQYLYWAIGPSGIYPKLSQTGYIWENDDRNDTGYDDHTQQAAGNTAITSVRKGERLNLRTQIKNTGNGSLQSDLGLFYDRNSDGIFTKVSSNKSPNTSGGNCTDNNFDCTTVDNLGTDTGSYTSMTISPSGTKWISYYDTTNGALKVAASVGSGTVGNCSNGAWQCYTVDNDTDNTGQYSSIALDEQGNPWISYYDATATQLMVAQYVGTGGTGCGTGGSTAWNCEAVDNTGTNTGTNTEIHFDVSNKPWVAYYDTTNTSLRVATRGGGFGANCTDTDWTCGVVDNDTDNTGQYASLAFSPSNNPWISYYDDTADQLMVAQFVGGTSGSGCGASGSTAWTCEAVDNTGTDTGQYTSIAFSPDGTPWVSYYDVTNADLRLATRGGGFGTTCTNANWTCGIVDGTGTIGLHTGIAFAANGVPWISYYDNDSTATNKSLKYARYVGTGGNCNNSGGSAAFYCSKVDSIGADAVGEYTSIAFDPDGVAWISYYDGGTETALKVANINRAGDIISSPGLAGSNGINIDDTSIARWTGTPANGVAITSPSFTPQSNTLLVVAIGADAAASSNLTMSVSSSTGLTWTNRVERDFGDGTNGHTSIWTAVAPVSTPMTISVQRTSGSGNSNRISAKAYIVSGADTSSPIGQVGKGASTTNNLTAAAYTSSVNNSRGIGAATDFNKLGLPASTDVADAVNHASQLSTLSAYKQADTSPSGTAVTLNFDAAGTAAAAWGWVAMEIKPSVADNAQLESHADMTSTTDSANRDDADCSGGGTWNNGKWSEAEEIADQSLPVGSGTAQCTEVGFTLDTSQAIANTSYRFIVASEDGFRKGKGLWRGPISVTQYPTLTIESSTTVKLAKDVQTVFSTAGCTSGTSPWGCQTIDGLGATAADGQFTSTTFDVHGNAWISYFDASSTAVKVAHYVGSGGNCTSTAWQCDIVDTIGTNANDGSYTSIAMGTNNVPWVVYHSGTDTAIKVAKYVGSGGNCTSTAWQCDIVDTIGTNANDGRFGQIVIDYTGMPWISYHDGTNTAVKVARYVGVGGNCTSTAWNCEIVDTLGTNAADGQFTSIAAASDGTIWLSYFDGTNTAVKVARLLWGGGSGCTSVNWSCETVDTIGTNANDGRYTDIAIDGNGVPWISYQDGTNTAVRVAKRGAGLGLSCTTSPWTCEIVDGLGSAAADGAFTSIAIDQAGAPVVSYDDASNTGVKVANYVGSGGGCTSNKWNCVMVDSIGTNANDGTYTSTSIDNSGIPWVSYQDGTNTALKIAKLPMPTKQPQQLLSANTKGRNAKFGGARFALDFGKTPRSESGCSTTNDFRGYCGANADDTDFDSMVAKANERPLYLLTQTHTNNTDFATVTWKGKSTTAPSSKTINLEVYNVTAAAWQTFTLDNNCNSTAANTDCTMSGSLTSSMPDYYEDDPNSSNYFLYFRVYQTEGTAIETLRTDQFSVRLNVPPDAPTALVQRKIDDTTIPVNGWINETGVEYTASATDGNATDTLYLCIETKTLGTPFVDGSDTCAVAGTGYSGSAVSLLHTISSQAEGEYHWRARVKDNLGAYSSYVSYPISSPNAETVRDYGIDTTPPTSGTVFDGTTTGSDDDFNNGSLTTLSANWNAASFNTNISGLSKFQYSIGTTVGGTNVVNWTDCTPIPTCNTTPAVTVNTLSLNTSSLYYFNVRAVDAAGNTQTAIATSDGIAVAPTLTFSISGTSVTFSQLNDANNRTDTKTMTLSASTNAMNGYEVRAFNNQLLTGAAMFGSPTIPAFTPGTYASPAGWGSNFGFGYTTNDTDIAQFPASGSCLGGGTAPCYAPFILSGPGDVVMTRNSPIVAGESNILTYKVAVSPIQRPVAYTNNVIFTMIPRY